MALRAQPTRDPKNFKTNEGAANYLAAAGFAKVTDDNSAFPWLNATTGKRACRAVDCRGRYCVYYMGDWLPGR